MWDLKFWVMNLLFVWKTTVQEVYIINHCILIGHYSESISEEKCWFQKFYVSQFPIVVRLSTPFVYPIQNKTDADD